MDEPIEELYFNWLYSKVVPMTAVSTPSNNYYTLLRDLHSTEFIWLLSGDDNRAEDGLEIRKEFCVQTQLDAEPWFEDTPCSVLEMLIGFSRRASFDTELSPTEWFWIFLDNLGISEFSDARLRITERINEILDVLIWRTYDANGDGGLFPLDNPMEDQRKVEIWYQFCSYLVEQDIF